MEIGERLTIERKKTGLNQTMFAEKLGLKLTAYKNYEKDTRKIPVPVLIALVDVYGTDIHWLLTGEKWLEREKNVESLRAVVQGVLLFLEKHDLELPAEKMADLIVVLYRKFTHDSDVSLNEMNDMVRLAM
ncbi:helix-turn-helix domain-containing protein [Curvivirga aplysinae]|uniref:helix-turn-helix domain-containing protein n=1 Tax=Curvivirga aplysinae TaxID=2529852 RepID=UPI001C3FC4C2|nr:helix-turn-helix transcriptional regulator [Curvivirga aplysinae]